MTAQRSVLKSSANSIAGHPPCALIFGGDGENSNIQSMKNLKCAAIQRASMCLPIMF